MEHARPGVTLEHGYPVAAEAALLVAVGAKGQVFHINLEMNF